MGRGRQKAKQTKVARQLKYFSPETDYDALQRELATGNGGNVTADDGDEGEDLDNQDSEHIDRPTQHGQ